MKKLLLFLGITIITFLFPFKFFSLPETWTLSVKDFAAEQLLHDSSKNQPAEGYINQLKIGMTKQQVEQITGKSKNTLRNQYGERWYIYHHNYQRFTLVNYSDQKVTGIYSMAGELSSEGIKGPAVYDRVKKRMGPPLKYIEAEDYRLKLDEPHSLMYQQNQQYTTYYFDQYDDNHLTAIKIVTKKLEQQKKRLYANPVNHLAEDYAKLEFYLTNADRVRFGLKPLSFHQQISRTALKHSKDMAEHHYFSHTNQQGLSPFDRMAKDGLDYYTAGENLAYGQISPIEAHNGLMNSKGHRENILSDNFEQLGVGVAFSNENVPYYTENYITER